MDNETLLKREDALFIVVDIQEKLLPAISNGEEVLANSTRLVKCASHLHLPMIVSEQYPKGLGPTTAELEPLLASATRVEKMSFSCAGCDEFMNVIDDLDCDQAVIFGIETHVCVLQTALDLMEQGVQVHVVADAVGSRKDENRKIALDRIRQAGGIITCTESVLFELLRVAGTSEFKAISQLIR
ncbi:MAG: hydrolase [Planctomycetes bacterium]|nr:hydrolase [Planctomycetota bacterium]